MKKICIIGNGSHSKGIIQILKDIDKIQEVELDKYGYQFNLARHHNSFFNIEYPIYVAINNSKLRSEVTEEILLRGGKLGPPLIHPSAIIGDGCYIGDGSVIQAGVVLTTAVQIKENVHINVGSTISQGSTIGYCSTISPGVHLAGEVNIGKRVQIGVGASVINLVDVTDGVTIGAGAIVVKSITESGTYVGVPAKRLEKELK